MKRIFVTCCFAGTLLAAASCGEKPTDPVVEESSNITVGSANATAFTATITGTFSGIDKMDLALGKYGVLYCEKSADVDAKFKTWLESGDYAGCMAFDKGKINRLSYSGTVTGLKPDTEYSFCLFSQSQDGTRRETSAVQTFRTMPFDPVISEVRMDSIRYFDAVAKGSIKDMNDVDAGLCEMGFLLSESEDCNVNNSTTYPFTGSNPSSQRFWFMELNPSTTFHIRLYIGYPTLSGQNAYVYGPEVTFSTRDFNETAVDLGLPSGIKWSSVVFGGWGPVSNNESCLRFQWGASARFTYDNDQKPTEAWKQSQYEHWDAASSSCRNIGTEISGTDYDVVHLMLGGKWRMPSKADLDELIANCNVSEWENAGTDIFPYYGLIKGPNGNVVKINFIDSYWCGTAAGNDNAYVFRYSAEYGNNNYKVNTGKIEILTRPKTETIFIRAVLDPAMPD